MKSKNSIPFIISGISVVILFSYLTTVFSVELREISAIIAETILKISGLAIERTNTILTLGDLKFDIIPACNGSTTLTVLFLCGLFLVAGNSKLGILRKIASVILVIPVALIANGIRLALLVYASHVRGEIVADGALHISIGILSFLLALTTLFAIFEVMQAVSTSKEPAHREGELFMFSIILITLAFFPFFAACIRDWLGTEYNKNDMLGYIFFIPGFLLYLKLWARSQRNHEHLKKSTLLISIVLILTTLFQVVNQNNYIYGISLILLLFLIALMERGFKVAMMSIPAVLMISLSYSKVSEVINQILHTEGFLVPFLVKILIMIILYTMICSLYNTPYCSIDNLDGEKSQGPVFVRYYAMMAIISLCSLFLSIQGYTTVEMEKIYSYHLDYLMGGWVGTEVKDNRAERYYAKKQLITRFYQKKGDTVGVMIVPSNAKSSNIHTPEYCQQALGWVIDRSRSISFTNRDNVTIEARKLSMHRKEDGLKRTFIYWFDDGSFSTGTYLSFVFRNSIQRILGERKNWILYIVWADTTEEKSGIDDFLLHFNKLKIQKITKKPKMLSSEIMFSFEEKRTINVANIE
jgi:exosortase/archaeosortase family protein